MLVLAATSCNNPVTFNASGSSYSSLSILANPDADGEKPAYVLGASAATIAWFSSGSGINQAVVQTNTDEGLIRVDFDSDCQVTRFCDLDTGDFTVINEVDENRIDYLTYQLNGVFISGYRIYREADKIFFVEIKGSSPFEGQLQGQLDGGMAKASFAVIPTGLTAGVTPREISAAQYAMFTALEDDFDARGVSRGFSDLSSTLLKAGGLLIVGASVGVMAPAYGAAGVCMVLSSLLNDQIDNEIERRFDDETQPTSVRSGVGAVIKTLSSLTTTSLSGLCDRFISAIGTGDSADDTVVDEIAEKSDSTSLSLFYGNPVPDRDNTGFPSTRLPTVDAKVTGQAVNSAGTVYNLTGTVSKTGVVELTGATIPSATTSSTIDIDCTYDLSSKTGTGTFSSSDGNSGVVTVKQAALAGFVAVDMSGGQGAFSNIHGVAGANDVVFTCDAYSIKDAFEVFGSNGLKLFSTGGLVSGSKTGTFSVTGMSYVFVNVSAPLSGTAWEYQLSEAN